MRSRRIPVSVFLLVLFGSFCLGGGTAFPQSAPPPGEKREGGEKYLDRSEVARYLEKQMQRTLGDQRKTVRVKNLQGGERVPLPAGDLSWEARIPDRFYQGGSVPVSLILRAGVDKAREVRFHARVEIYADVVVARNSLRKHRVVEEEDIQVVNKNITPLPGDIVTDLQEVLGKRMTLSVNGQEVLRKSMVEIPPLVKKGDRVTLLAENPSFRITSAGEAREDGRKGDRIRVVNISSKKEVSGRVLDNHTVQVDF